MQSYFGYNMMVNEEVNIYEKKVDADSEDEDSEDNSYHPSWVEFADELYLEEVYLDSLSDDDYTRQVTCQTIEEREPVYPPRLWSTVVAEGRVSYTCG